MYENRQSCLQVLICEPLSRSSPFTSTRAIHRGLGSELYSVDVAIVLYHITRRCPEWRTHVFFIAWASPLCSSKEGSVLKAAQNSDERSGVVVESICEGTVG